MLKIYKIVGFLFIIIFHTSIEATDISNFSINGVQLGMHKNKVLQLIPCNTPKIESYKMENGLIYYYFISCDNVKNKNIKEYIAFDHNENVFKIKKIITFSKKPNFKKIVKKVIKRYGEADLVATEYYHDHTLDNSLVKGFCWGEDCSLDNPWNIHSTGKNISLNFSYPQLKVSYKSLRFADGGSTYNVQLELKDPKLNRRNDEWKIKKENEQLEKSSDIDF